MTPRQRRRQVQILVLTIVAAFSVATWIVTSLRPAGHSEPAKPNPASNEMLELEDLDAGELPSARRQVLEGHTSEVASLSFSADGRFLVSGSAEEFLVWNVAELRVQQQLTNRETEMLTRPMFADDGLDIILLKEVDGALARWQFIKGQWQPRYAKSERRADTWPSYHCLLSASRDGRWLAYGKNERFRGEVPTPRPPTFFIRESRHGELPMAADTLKEMADDRIKDAVFSPSGRFAALIVDSGHTSHTLIRLFDVTDGRVRARYYPLTDSVRAVEFSPNEKYFAACGGMREPKYRFDWKPPSVMVWNIKDKTGPRVFEGHAGTVHALAFSPDGRLLATGGSDSLVILWDVESGKQLATLEGHEQSVSALAFTPDGKTLASGGWDKKIFLWDVGRIVPKK